MTTSLNDKPQASGEGRLLIISLPYEKELWG